MAASADRTMHAASAGSSNMPPNVAPRELEADPAIA